MSASERDLNDQRCERGDRCAAYLDEGPCDEPDCPWDRHRRLRDAWPTGPGPFDSARFVSARLDEGVE